MFSKIFASSTRHGFIFKNSYKFFHKHLTRRLKKLKTEKADSLRDAYRDEIFQQYTENIQSLIRIQRNQAIDVWTIKYVLLDAPLMVDEVSADHI